MTLADLLERNLKKRQVTQIELANHLQITNTSFTKWMRKRGRRDPIPWRHWKAICQYLGIPWKRWWIVALHDHPKNAECYRRFSRLV